MKNKNIFYKVLLLLFTSKVYANFFSISLLGGPTFTHLHNEPYVPLNSVVTNLYQASQHDQTEGMIGVRLGYAFENKWFSSYAFSCHVSGYWMNLGKVAGVEYPFINQGMFDTLRYRFQANSRAILFEPELTYTAYRWQPFLRAGLGGTQNNLKNYHEWPTDSASSAASIFPAFNNQTTSQFAYDLGVGIQYQFTEASNDHPQLSGAVSYQYFNLGQGQLGRFPTQTAISRLQVNTLQAQTILFQLALSFA